jgi:hypothetical protein
LWFNGNDFCWVKKTNVFADEQKFHFFRLFNFFLKKIVGKIKQVFSGSLIAFLFKKLKHYFQAKNVHLQGLSSFFLNPNFCVFIIINRGQLKKSNVFKSGRVFNVQEGRANIKNREFFPKKLVFKHSFKKINFLHIFLNNSCVWPTNFLLDLNLFLFVIFQAKLIKKLKVNFFHHHKILVFANDEAVVMKQHERVVKTAIFIAQ